jgi:hypothetical protein
VVKLGRDWYLCSRVRSQACDPPLLLRLNIYKHLWQNPNRNELQELTALQVWYLFEACLQAAGSKEKDLFAGPRDTAFRLERHGM